MNQISRFYQSAKGHYQKASSGNKEIEFTFRLDAYIIKLYFSNSVMAEKILPSLLHLKRNTELNENLSIYIWDNSSIHLNPLFFPWTPEDILQRGEIRGYNDERYCTSYVHGAHGLMMLDREKSIGYFWLNDIEKLPYYEKSAPLRNLLHWWLRSRGLMLTHSSAVSDENGAILFVGKGGSGKSTTALSCLTDGLMYLSDDYCITSNKSKPEVFCLYNSAKMSASTFELFPDLYTLKEELPYENHEKMVFQLYPNYKDKLQIKAPLKAIVLPCISNRKIPLMKPMSSATALLALAPSSIYQVPLAAKLELIHFSKLVGSLPCYTIELGVDVKTNVSLIKNLLNESGG